MNKMRESATQRGVYLPIQFEKHVFFHYIIKQKAGEKKIIH